MQRPYILYPFENPNPKEKVTTPYRTIRGFFCSIQQRVKTPLRFQQITKIKGGKVILRCLRPADQLDGTVFLQKQFCGL